MEKRCKKNLDVWHRNGDPIPQVYDMAQWSKLTTEHGAIMKTRQKKRQFIANCIMVMLLMTQGD
jgi:hypothetical protein